MTGKTPKNEQRPADLPDDLAENPGIGQSRGLFARAGARDSDLVAGESTVEGDVENDAALGQGAGTDAGRTNE